jgi:hypothetical protein
MSDTPNGWRRGSKANEFTKEMPCIITGIGERLEHDAEYDCRRFASGLIDDRTKAIPTLSFVEVDNATYPAPAEDEEGLA